MIGIVGAGPRTGTSYLMQQLDAMGLPVVGEKQIKGWTVEEENPLGYYELEPQDLLAGLEAGAYEDLILKIWPPALTAAHGLKKVVVLERRDRDAHLMSIRRTLDAEVLANGISIQFTPDEILDIHYSAIDRWLDSDPGVDHLHVFTEELDERLGEIVTFIGDPSWQS